MEVLKKIVIALYLLFILIEFAFSRCNPKYDYSDLMEKNIKFFKAQRSGDLPDNDIPWRDDAFVDEEGEEGEDLSGGFHDAGDTVKYNYKGAHVATTLAWSLLEFKTGYDVAGTYSDAREMLKFQLDYLLKCFVEDGDRKYIYAVCGDTAEHQFWENPQNMEKKLGNSRRCYRVFHESNKHGSDLAGEMAASFAASSMVFENSDSSYASKLLGKAKTLYQLANKHPRNTYDKYMADITKAPAGSSSLKYYDDIAWAAAWLYKATDDTTYQSAAKYRWRSSPLRDRLNRADHDQQFSWYNKFHGVAALMTQIGNTNDRNEAKAHLKKFCKWMKDDARTAANSAHSDLKGMVWFDNFLPARRIAKQVTLCLVLNKYFPNDDSLDFTKFSTRQIHLLIGDAKSSKDSSRRQSYVVGFAKGSRTDSPQQPHHRAASCPTGSQLCGFGEYHKDESNPNELTGGLVGGPTLDGEFNDRRNEIERSEVSISGMAGFQMAIAGLLTLQDRDVCHYA